MSHINLQAIFSARSRITTFVRHTPLEFSRGLGAHLKLENLQRTGSFKLRGALNRILSLSDDERRRGVVAASAGNHAQGVAYAAQRLGCEATIVMPATTPQIKVAAVAARGARVLLTGDSYDDAYAHASTLGTREKLTFVHPYDDPDVIAGQGTIGMEILRSHSRPIEAIFAAVGGGGLISGIAAYVKRLRPEIKIIGVEPIDSDAMAQSLAAGHRVRLGQVGLFADGVAVKQVGEETFRLARTLVDEMVLVDNDDICAAIKDVFEDTRSILEPAGALAVAGTKAWVERRGVRGRTLVAVASGANMNFDRLRFVAERAELGERREAILAVTIPERPGSFKRFCSLIGTRNVTEFNYRYADAARARVFVGLSIHNRAETQTLVRHLQRHGLETEDFSDNEMAKLHIRHMVGGHSPRVRDEMVYRFEFPERPGALMNFLDRMSQDWNISLFHYRNHGADFGRVLVGMQVPRGEKAVFRAFLKQLNYRYWDETANPAYRLFLGQTQ